MFRLFLLPKKSFLHILNYVLKQKFGYPKKNLDPFQSQVAWLIKFLLHLNFL